MTAGLFKFQNNFGFSFVLQYPSVIGEHLLLRVSLLPWSCCVARWRSGYSIELVTVRSQIWHSTFYF